MMMFCGRDLVPQLDGQVLRRHRLRSAMATAPCLALPHDEAVKLGGDLGRREAGHPEGGLVGHRLSTVI